MHKYCDGATSTAHRQMRCGHSCFCLVKRVGDNDDDDDDDVSDDDGDGLCLNSLLIQLHNICKY